MKTKALFTIAILALAGATAHAKSDTDVYLTEVKEVTIAEDTVTITGSALTRITTISEDPDPHYDGKTYVGKAADSTYVSSQEAIFTIKRSQGPDGKNPFWPDCLAAAKALKAGQPTGRIAFYRPEIVIKGNRIVAITGHGSLMQKPGERPATTHVQADPDWAGTWRTKFANGVKQFNTFSREKNRGSTVGRWSSDGEVTPGDGHFFITYDENRVERWTRVGSRMVVEHWHPASSYPAAKPVLGIAERDR